MAFKAEYSIDGKQWKILHANWRMVPPEPYEAPDTWSQSFFYGANDISGDEADEIRVRISNNLGKRYQMGQFALIYQTKNRAKTEVTHCWAEAGQEKTAAHVYPADATMDASWKIDTGKEPQWKWVEMTPVPAE